jgi:two-component system, OmpR family, phosphate regulon response regulator PhoB
MARVTVVDDDADIRFLVVRRLERAGHTVSEAADGEAGLAAIRMDDPDLVVLDWMMPGLTGIDVLERLRAGDRLRPRVLMLTARTQESDVARAREAGADGFLVKPFTAPELLEAVGALLDPA